MEIPDDVRERQAWMLDILIRNYGVRGYVIDPDNHPNVVDLPQPDTQDSDSSIPEARYLKRNEFLYDIMAYLSERYGLFTEALPVTSCPVRPWFGDATPDSRYRQCFRIVPRHHGYLAFTCRQGTPCEWRQCPVHPSVPFAEQRLDPFDLLQILNSITHGCRYPSRHGTISEYVTELSQGLGISVKTLRASTISSASGLGRPHGFRRAVNKNQLLIELKSVPRNTEQLQDFLDRVTRLILAHPSEQVYDRTYSSTTVWLPDSAVETIRTLRTAARLWLYVWILQQQEGNRVIADIKGFAEFLGVTDKALYRYRDTLERQGTLIRRKCRGKRNREREAHVPRP